jgi:hypothetical protein
MVSEVLQYCKNIPADEGPYLLVIVDAEEEFDWATFSSAATAVRSMKAQEKAQRLFAKYHLKPTYVVDFPVASQPDGYRPLQEFLADGVCHVGAQLHPWVNPPIEEKIGEHNSFPCNLPPALELEKLRRLTREIEANLKIKPIVYRAGRYGAGPNTAEMLSLLDYQVDCSVLPWTDLRPGHGPDFRTSGNKPYWFGRGLNILEIPVTIAFLGLLAPMGATMYPHIAAPLGRSLKLQAISARLRLLDRIRLTPEGISLSEAKRLTWSLLRRERHRIFVLSYHSPSLEPGHTPYVRTQADLANFLSWIEEYLAFFFHEVGGKPATPQSIRERLLQLRGPTPQVGRLSAVDPVFTSENK